MTSTANGKTTDAERATRGAGTTAVHGDGTRRDEPYHALTTPILQSATFTFRDSDDVASYMAQKYRGGAAREEYGRYGNPTVVEVERKLAALDGGETARKVLRAFRDGNWRRGEQRERPVRVMHG